MMMTLETRPRVEGWLLAVSVSRLGLWALVCAGGDSGNGAGGVSGYGEESGYGNDNGGYGNYGGLCRVVGGVAEGAIDGERDSALNEEHGGSTDGWKRYKKKPFLVSAYHEVVFSLYIA